MSHFTKIKPNHFSKTLGEYEVQVKFFPIRRHGKAVGERAVVEITKDPTLKPGIAHEAVRFETPSGKLNRDMVYNVANRYLVRVARGV